ncbi:MAG: SulP family inorganic anion transporter [Phycisphaerae bacterium]|nr:SulP family inorganic anion transporter [Phycisphaerae bacterium]
MAFVPAFISDTTSQIVIESSALRQDFQAGITVALVGVPQCMGFAALAGLPPAMGLYSAVVMGIVNGLVTTSSKSIIGPAITTSSMVYGVLASVAPRDIASWPAIAGLLAVMVGGLTLILAVLRVGEMVRFVSRSVLIGLTVGVGVLIFGAQLAPFLGISVQREPRLGMLILNLIRRMSETSWPDVLMGTATFAIVLVGGRLGRRFPAAFVSILAGGFAVWLLERFGVSEQLVRIEPVPREWPPFVLPAYHGEFRTDLVFGSAAICAVGMIQTLALSKAFASKNGERIDARREMIALGLSNVTVGFCGGFPGAESISRSVINDTAGARTRMSGVICAIATAIIVFGAAPYTQYITRSAIAGLLMATAWSVVDWREVRDLLTHARHDRIVLITTVVCLVALPIHWAVLIGLTVSIAMFLRRVSRLYLVEMVAGKGRAFHEHAIDKETGHHPITMLQVEGPLFFAQAEELSDVLGRIFNCRPAVVIIRMRRTQHIDYSVIIELNRVVQRYISDGGTLIICGLTDRMHEQLSRSPLGRTLDPRFLLKTTRKVFSSAHAAIELAETIARGFVPTGTNLLRAAPDSRHDKPDSVEAEWSYEI